MLDTKQGKFFLFFSFFCFTFSQLYSPGYIQEILFLFLLLCFLFACLFFVLFSVCMFCCVAAFIFCFNIFFVSLMCDFVFSCVSKFLVVQLFLCVLIYIGVVVLVFALFTLLLCYFIFYVCLYSGSFARPLISCESLAKIFHMLSFKYNGKLARDKSFLINLSEDWSGEITCIKCESENSFLISQILLFLLLWWCFSSLFFVSYLFPSFSPFSLLSFFLMVWSYNNFYCKNQDVYIKNHQCKTQ